MRIKNSYSPSFTDTEPAESLPEATIVQKCQDGTDDTSSAKKEIELLFGKKRHNLTLHRMGL